MNMVPKNKIKCPIAAELTIPESELKESKDVPGKAFYNKWLTTSHLRGVKYVIGIYPNDNDHEGETWVYFQLVSKINIEGEVKISIVSANYNYEKDGVFEPAYNKGEILCTTEEFFAPESRYIVDGKLTMKMNGFLMIEKEEDTCGTWGCENTGDSLCLALWEQENTKDFKIVVGEKEVIAHKNVLAARSPVFARMFQSGMKEAQEGKVEIKDFPYGIVEKAIKLCYHHSLVTCASLDDRIKVLQFLDKYDIQKLKDNLENYLITVINELTICRLVNGALLSNATKLEDKCVEFLRDCLRNHSLILIFLIKTLQ